MKGLVLGMLAVAILALLSACAKNNTVDVEAFQFREGSEGLIIAFENNLPPEEIYENTVVPLYLSVENRGAEPARQATVVFVTEERILSINSGLSLSNQPVRSETANKVSFDLEGRSIRNPIGGKGYITGSMSAKDIGKQKEEITTSLVAQICYPYKTILRASVCLDTDVYKEIQLAKSCTMEDLSPGTQGAPIAISKIEPKVAPHPTDLKKVIPRFTFTIENAGEGEVLLSRDAAQACSDQTSVVKFNELRLLAYIPGENGVHKLTCNTAVSDEAKDVGVVRLKDDTGKISCSLEEGIEAERGAFSELIEIELDYGYSETIKRDLKIRKAI